MAWLRALHARIGRHLAWRLLAVFVLAALVPLAVSDWIATSVVAGVADRLGRDRDGATTRAASRQVFDRLMLSATLLRSIDEAREGDRGRLAAGSTAADAPFSSVACADSDPAQAGRLLVRWQAAGGGLPAIAGRSANLRFEQLPNGRGDLLMASMAASLPRCIAVVSPAFVWEPVVDASDDSTWTIRTDAGGIVHLQRGAEATPATDRRATTATFTAHLFLAAEFGAANWTFEQVAPPAAVRWHGMPIVAWLLSVASATLLLIGLAVSRTLRQTLRPLEALTEGSRRLAAGSTPTRVEVGRDDELGRLATTFNHMAGQLEDRMAALRALADVDADILAGADFRRIAERALRRLATLVPEARWTLAWREDDARGTALQVVAGDASGLRVLDGSHALTPDDLQRFECLGDGPWAFPSAAWLPPAEAAPSACRIWGVRHAGLNRAVLCAQHAGDVPDLQEARDLRDRLAVAIVARDREDQLQHRATHDALTGLRNTYGLQQAFAPLLAADARLAVLFVDLDHFKDVNDCYGHAVGDRLLQSAARRLERTAPAGALLSRNGGDEFVVVLPGADAAGARALADRLLESLKQAFILSTTEHRSSASIGIALFPDHGLDREDLLRCADIALYESKNAGRGRWTVFEPAFDSKLRDRNELLAGLDRALSRSEFVVHYQPRFAAANGALAGAEALVRWQHPERGFLLPGLFIEAAESAGLIDALGRHVLEIAIAQMARWRSDGLAIARLSVNVSQRQFESRTLVAHVRDTLARHGLAGAQLEVEVTESVLGGDIASVRRQLHELRALGITVAMDDFGTGYSSLSQLRTLPIDVMKIDRAFVKDLETDPDAVAIARTIVTLARALGLRIVAEGIETPAQAALLAGMGCDEFQGFLFSKAVPPERLVELQTIRLPAATS